MSLPTPFGGGAGSGRLPSPFTAQGAASPFGFRGGDPNIQPPASLGGMSQLNRRTSHDQPLMHTPQPAQRQGSGLIPTPPQRNSGQFTPDGLMGANERRMSGSGGGPGGFVPGIFNGGGGAAPGGFVPGIFGGGQQHNNFPPPPNPNPQLQRRDSYGQGGNGGNHMPPPQFQTPQTQHYQQRRFSNGGGGSGMGGGGGGNSARGGHYGNHGGGGGGMQHVGGHNTQSHGQQQQQFTPRARGSEDQGYGRGSPLGGNHNKGDWGRHPHATQRKSGLRFGPYGNSPNHSPSGPLHTGRKGGSGGGSIEAYFKPEMLVDPWEPLLRQGF